ncbi:MAG: DUF418 domain-containing protein [Pedobacter sp.]|nr:DUF418 domain-containing protein [Pedobacter sp.]MDQ8052754.1 DUF418 domain-containing protein [Pedobacter sp.]
METALSQPVQQQQRTIVVDVLRGWALFGVVLMNYFDFFTLGQNWATFKPTTLDSVLFFITNLLFSAKSWTLLSLLFGYGFAVLMNNIREKGHEPYRFFAGRMFWLFVLAFINSAIFFGDILKDYAALGLLLLLFYRSSAKTTFWASTVLFLAIPPVAAFVNSLGDQSWNIVTSLFPKYLSHNLIDVFTFGLKATYFGEMIYQPYLYTVHLVMFCCMLWGFTLYKINFFADLASKRKWILWAFWTGLALAVFFNVFFMVYQQQKWLFLKHFQFRYWLVLSTMICIGSGICWLYIAGKLKTVFQYFAWMGKMTLTNYIVQNIIGLLVFSGFGLGIWSTYPLWFYLLLATVIFIIQLFVSKWWLKKYNYGPIEWIWRQLSYRKKLPLKRT